MESPCEDIKATEQIWAKLLVFQHEMSKLKGVERL
jgi:hypothetical protein